jgi:methyltransferase-like protein/2-polyprenyl-3-methyl-5-hydroxy-6-metoxy-1,4-benzoquinol methylase
MTQQKNGLSTEEKTLHKNHQDDIKKIKDSYDVFPYESFAFVASNPAHLRSVAKLFGLDAPKLENARVLELGCASGGNIIPFAAKFPNAEIIGVDLSDVQIKEGQDFIKKLGLKNIELKACSITDIDASYGKFDYIINHGVFSWVPDFVREKMLSIASENLSQNGVAYISYNTLPGWNTLRTIRDMALFHSKSFASPQEKVTQARLLLDFIKDSVKGSDSSYSKLMMESVELLKDKPDYYIAHDFLEDNNKQFYFSDFMEMAQKHNLQYLSDSSVSTMFLGNLSEDISKKLGEINDIIRTEQYLDFIRNRTFRSSLLCHNNVKINRNLNQDDIEKFLFRINLVPAKLLAEIDIENNLENLEFHINGNKEIKIGTNSSIMKAVLYSSSENAGKYLEFEELSRLALKKLKNVTKLDIEKEMRNNLMRLFISGNAQILSDPIKAKFEVTAKPKAFDYAKGQCKELKKLVVTNLYHDNVALDLFESFMIQYLDGKNTKEQILEHLLKHAKGDEINVNVEQKKIEDEKQILEIFSQCYDNSIKKFAMNALLV